MQPLERGGFNGSGKGWNVVREVPVPELDTVAYIHPISARRMLAWANVPNDQASAELVAASVCDQYGVDLEFTADEVQEWPAGLFQAICTAALELNGLSVTPEARVGN